MSTFKTTKLSRARRATMLAVAAGVIAIPVIAPGTTPPAANAASNVAVFFSPHQDDETLTLGPGIIEHVRAGREVHIALVTDGSASGAHAAINKKLASQGKPTITITEFVEARMREFKEATAKMGVLAKNLHFENFKDGTLTRAQAQSVIDKYIARYPGAAYKTTTWLDAHSDHAYLGSALNTRCQQQAAMDCRFYQATPYRLDVSKAATAAGATTFPPVVTPRVASKTVSSGSAFTNALNEYKTWDPNRGRYSVGYISVKNWFDFVERDRSAPAHMNSKNYLSQADINSAVAWLKKYQPTLA